MNKKIEKKELVRIRLVNWHYFENETISLSGSTLISGDNTAGKSTILDAIQLVLTTNSRRFNTAANEKGSRTLKSYVRCKTGNMGQPYLRKGAVPANVALEFYEERTGKYFVLGVHMFSPDEEDSVKRNWYSLDNCRLEELSFVTKDNKPARAEEFRRNGDKIRYLNTDKDAKNNFSFRLGNLEDKFFDIIPKSLAFKPMDNVKDFINKFVLTEANIEVDRLRENIESLNELEALLEKSKKQLSAIREILSLNDQIDEKEKEIRINDILLILAENESISIKLNNAETEIRSKEQFLLSDREEEVILEKEIKSLSDAVIALNVELNQNDAHKLAEEIERRLENLRRDNREYREKAEMLSDQQGKINAYNRELKSIDMQMLRKEEIDKLAEPCSVSEKQPILEKIREFFETNGKQIENMRSSLDFTLGELNDKIRMLTERLSELEKHRLTFPENTVLLKNKIEKEFENRGISSNVYVLAELLDITDEKWRNAVEGYFNTQKFYIIVEPEYYDIALEVYHKNRGKIHSAGLINTKKIPLDYEVDIRSLFYVIKGNNRYALAYAHYILGRVICCDKLQELEEYSLAITADCMLYQNYVARVLNPETYKNPFIGAEAYRVQLENTRRELEEKSTERKKCREEKERIDNIIKTGKNINLEICKMVLDSPRLVSENAKNISESEKELEEANKDSSYIELNMKLQSTNEKKDDAEGKRKELQKEIARLEKGIDDLKQQARDLKNKVDGGYAKVKEISDAENLAFGLAKEKYQQNRKTKAPSVILDNFSPRGAALANQKNDFLNSMILKQSDFNHSFAQDYLTGREGINDYRKTESTLRTVDIVKNEEKLKKAREDCEEIFKKDFLSKMKGHIDDARLEFKNLNRALDNVSYGDDKYHFTITYDKKKESLYRMITSENNMEGYNLWTASFEAEYHEEMEDLFSKLLTRDDNGQKIVEEYTDYRSYLDYDIEIIKPGGKKQRFSDVYGEKSGSETQVPYYVAIGASFYQLYRLGNTARLMLMDEAFDKMDDERIVPMMEFFNSLELQVIMATPPQKIEIIGEHVDTVLTAIRTGESSIVEEYEFY